MIDSAVHAPFAIDVAVVGGGSSGCVVAARLVAQGRNVALIEAGPDYGPFGSPRWASELVDARALATTHDWGYAAGRWTFERARVIGGCSAHNGAIAAVGHRRDYDAWDLPGWNGDDVAPLFRQVVETMRVRTYTRDEAGPFHARCLDAAQSAGWRMADDLCDLDANDSFGLETVNIVGTTRWNTAFAYLDPVRDNANLWIVDEAIVDRIDSDVNGATVIGERHGVPFTIECGTVVLSAGVYATPAILQRSGVGDSPARRRGHHTTGAPAGCRRQPARPSHGPHRPRSDTEVAGMARRRRSNRVPTGGTDVGQGGFVAGHRWALRPSRVPGVRLGPNEPAARPHPHRSGLHDPAQPRPS